MVLGAGHCLLHRLPRDSNTVVPTEVRGAVLGHHLVSHTSRPSLTSWAFLFALMLVAMPASAADLAGQATIIDGDTIEIHGTRVRLFGIDAPESAQTCTMGGK